MLWFVLLAGAVGARVLLATLRTVERSPLSRALLFDFTVKRTPNAVLSDVSLVLILVAFLVAVAGLIELVRAPFSPRGVPRP